MKNFLILITLLTGCAYPKRTLEYKTEALQYNKALIYIYRPPTSTHFLNPEIPKFYLNGDVVGKLSIGGYYLQLVEPGEVSITYKNSFLGFYPLKSGEVKLVAKSNHKYFIKYSLEGIMEIVTFKEVAIDQGELEIKTTKLLVN